MKNRCSNKYTGSQDAASECVLCIIGENTFNNEVLSSFLASQTGMECRCAQLSSLPGVHAEWASGKTILFMDCASLGRPKMCEMTITREILQDKRFKVVCFNVDPYGNCETRALRKGVRGLIYRHLMIDLYPRAAKAVINGELWYPRRVLEERFLSSDAPSTALPQISSILTRREFEILKMLGAGIKNQDIAKMLFISPHTVKTHAYNIYKKINVSNRFQAAQWLAKNAYR